MLQPEGPAPSLDEAAAKLAEAQAILQSSTASLPLVCLGDAIDLGADAEGGVMKGHGTMMAGEAQLQATVCGLVERVNKLVSVRALKGRYTAQVGDVVVGRVTEVAQKRWKMDVNGKQDAALLLASVNLPGGVQRRRTNVDELNMRELYQENDLISAEVQQINQGDGAVALHTRSAKYGKLQGGQLVTVAPYLIKRLKQHFVALAAPLDVGIILGCNGYVWIGSKDLVDAGGRDEDEGMEAAGPSGQVDLQLRERMCRVANAVRALAALGLPVHPPAIVEVCNLSGLLRVEIKDMLGPEFLAQVAYREADRRQAEGDAQPMDH